MLVPTPFTVLGFISIVPTLQIGIHDHACEGFKNYFILRRKTESSPSSRCFVTFTHFKSTYINIASYVLGNEIIDPALKPWLAHIEKHLLNEKCQSQPEATIGIATTTN